LVVHLFYLVGFQNRLLVLIRWSLGFATRGRGTRLITSPANAEAAGCSAAHLDGAEDQVLRAPHERRDPERGTALSMPSDSVSRVS
jgi:hypothetical protein